MGLVMILLAGCSPAPTTPPEPAPFELSEYGPHYVGTRKLSLHDANRDDRYVGVTVWYPALQPAN